MDTVLAVFDKGANSVQDIPQLEKFVMEDLFWSHTPMLQTISAHEGVTPGCRARIKAALEQALPPMQAYLEQYATYDAMFTKFSLPDGDYGKVGSEFIEVVNEDDTTGRGKKLTVYGKDNFVKEHEDLVHCASRSEHFVR